MAGGLMEATAGAVSGKTRGRLGVRDISLGTDT